MTVPIAQDTGTVNFTKLPNGNQWFAIQRDVGPTNNLWKYMVLGNWVLQTTAPISGQPIQPSNVGVFVTGSNTLSNSIPSSGIATYVGFSPSVAGYTFGGSSSPVFFSHGESLVNVNFATGGVSGSLNNIEFSNVGGADWIDVGLTGSLSATSLSGTSAVTYSSNSSLMNTSATGKFTGGLFGQGYTNISGGVGNELGLAWYVTDGSHTTVGTAGAEFDPNNENSSARGFNAVLQPIVGTTYSLSQAAFDVSGSTLTADASASANGTLTLLDPGTGTDLTSQTYELKIPSLGVDAKIQPVAETTVAPTGSNAIVGLSSGYVTLLQQGSWSYMFLGTWLVTASNPGVGQPLVPTTYGGFVAGYATPVTSMPTNGTATYSITIPTSQFSGYVSSPGSSGSLIPLTVTSSTATANFATGILTGSMNVGITPSGAPSSMNVSMNGSISGNTFSGTTAVTSATTAYMANGATGTFKGGFFGPNVNEIGAIWNVSDGTNKANAVYGAPLTSQTFTPSDRRLKRDAELVGVRSDGLRLYRFRYVGSDLMFTGVMAQDLLEDTRFAYAVARRPSGLLVVDYAHLGLACPDMEAMQLAGRAAIAAWEEVMAARRVA